MKQLNPVFDALLNGLSVAQPAMATGPQPLKLPVRDSDLIARVSCFHKQLTVLLEHQDGTRAGISASAPLCNCCITVSDDIFELSVGPHAWFELAKPDALRVAMRFQIEVRP